MGNPQRNDSQESGLPAPYINPWLSLRRDIKAILSDLRLRFVELFHRNNQNDFPTPSFLPLRMHVFFWPLLVFFIFVLISLKLISSYQSFFDSSSNKEGGQQKSSFSLNDQISNSVFVDQDSSEIIINDSDFTSNIKQNSFHIDSTIKSIMTDGDSVTKIDMNLFKGADLISLDNGVLFTVDNDWSKLSLLEKQLTLDILQDRLENFGFENIRIVDDTNRFVAKNSRIGKRMILYEQGRS